MARKKPTVLVAMSGGVDSSVVAAMLKHRGYDVIGVTMQIWQESQTDPRHGGCCSLGAVEDARRVARRLDIPYYVINFKKQFADTVISNFIDEYKRGRTPNPCVQCNRFVKFDALMEKAEELGCDYLATGHYARVRFNRHSNRWNMLRARALDKDQTYALYMLDQAQLSRVRFPLGELPGKHETRRIAAELGLWVANKPDSQEICFVAQAGGYTDFLKQVAPEAFEEGDIRDTSGKKLGTHGGVAMYTVGQRRRINLNLDGKPLYVIGISQGDNTIIVGKDEQLKRRQANVSEVTWSSIDPITKPLAVHAKIRYNMPAAPATLLPVEGDHERVIVEFKEPVRAVSPGQMAVFYKGQTVVGGGTID